MHFYINVNQRAIVEAGLNLDPTDAFIIDFCFSFSRSSYCEKLVHNNKDYYWFSYSNISNQLPMIKLKKRAVRNRLQKLADEGLLEAHPNNQGLGKAYFAITDLCTSIVGRVDPKGHDYPQVGGRHQNDKGCISIPGGGHPDDKGVGTKMTRGRHQNDKGVVIQMTRGGHPDDNYYNINTSNINTSNINTTTTREEKKIEQPAAAPQVELEGSKEVVVLVSWLCEQLKLPNNYSLHDRSGKLTMLGAMIQRCIDTHTYQVIRNMVEFNLRQAEKEPDTRRFLAPHLLFKEDFCTNKVNFFLLHKPKESEEPIFSPNSTKKMKERGLTDEDIQNAYMKFEVERRANGKEAATASLRNYLEELYAKRKE